MGAVLTDDTLLKTQPANAPAPTAPALVTATWQPSGAYRSFLEDIQIDFGPAAALGRLFLQSDTSARAKGLFLSFVSFEELLEINTRNLDTWQPLVPIFNPHIGGANANNGLCLIARNANGEVVGTTSIRLYSWLNTNLKIEAESLRLFYADPDKSKRPNEECIVTAPSAESVTGRVAFGGAVWFRPDYRKMNLHEILGRITKAAAFTRWYTDVSFALMAEHLVAQGFNQASGYAQLDWAVHLKNSPWGTARVALLTSTASQLLDEYLFEPSSALDPEIDTGVSNRTRYQHRRA